MSLPISIKEVPFFRIIAPFIAGIACQYWLAVLPFSWLNYFIYLLLLVTVFTCFFLASFWQLRWSFGLAVNVLFFFLGILLTIKQPANDKLLINSNNQAVAYLLDNPKLRIKSIRVEAEVKYLHANNTWWSANEKMIVYFDVRDSLASNLRYGSIIAVNITPQPIANSGNPNQFDYKKYLSDRGVYYSSYIKPNSWVYLGNEGVSIKKIALELRDKLVSLFKTYGLKGDELAVASALTLGYQDLLDDELRQVYSSSGAMHILSVSGLHVGILYLFLSFLLSFLNKRLIARAIKALILLIFLWFFALLTGLPPCVQRSALMFSFLVAGDFFNQKTNIYNTLAASAFVLLLINPYNLLDIGFQLSYLAIFSIVFFYPYVYRLIFIKSWVLDKVWSLIAVSIAAQFGTFSICLFYFNQFPNYFLLANLMAIPLSTIALYLSVCLIIISPFPDFAIYIGKLFSFSIGLLNHGLEYIEKMPYSVSEGLHLSALQLFVVFGVIMALSLYLINKRNRYILATLMLIVVFLCLNLNANIKRVNSKEFVVFNISKESLMSFRFGRNLLFIDVDTSKGQFTEKYNFFIKGYISEAEVGGDFSVFNPFSREINNCKISFAKIQNKYGVSFVSFNSKTIVIPFDKTLGRCVSKLKIPINYLVFNRYCSDNVFEFFKPNLVIIDSSVSKRVLANITLKCKHEGIPYHITSEQGAFVLNANDS